MQTPPTNTTILAPTPSATTKQKREITGPYGSVCELYAGIAVISAVLQELGWHIAMLCEKEEHLQQLLKSKFPTADVQEDVEAKPWRTWAAQGQTSMIVLAGVSCQPFSDAGQLRFQNDSRSDQALLVCDAAVTLGAMYVILENVMNYVTQNATHGVFTKVKQYFNTLGFNCGNLKILCKLFYGFQGIFLAQKYDWCKFQRNLKFAQNL